MPNYSAAIDTLSKVTLDLEAGTAPGSWDLTPRPERFEFIFGIGSSGLTPFEYQLAGLSEGEAVTMPVKQSEAWQFFGCLRPPIPQLAGNNEVFFLHARVLRVARAESREVVKAMADQAACGDCGGDCCGHSH
jgi:hypothetical protein